MKYYYKKYNTNTVAYYLSHETPYTSDFDYWQYVIMHENLLINYETGVIDLAGLSRKLSQNENDILYDFTLGNNYYNKIEHSAGSPDVTITFYILKQYSEPLYSRGDFIETIQSEDGILPDDGRYTDSFWYVKGEPVLSKAYMVVDANGQNKLKLVAIYERVENLKMKPLYAYQVELNNKLKKI